MLAERVIEDGFSFLLLIAVLAFLWFHDWHRRRPGSSEPTQSHPGKPTKKAA
jgi:hypothetical protein